MELQKPGPLCDTSTYLRVFDRLRQLDTNATDQLTIGRFPMTYEGFCKLVAYLMPRYYVYDPCWKRVDATYTMNLWQDFGVQVRRTPVEWDT